MTEPTPRPAARLLLIDERDRVLLFRARPGSALNGPFWFTPGGGLVSGETYEQAALRELLEETGITATIGPCVWTRRHVFSFLDRVYDQRERFYVVRVPPTVITIDGWEEQERDFMEPGRWRTLAEITASDEIFAPRRLADLLPPILAGDYPPEPIDAGV
jgi:8-oxo-dGTP pyrophosphatase MutT (NUDIX family)